MTRESPVSDRGIEPTQPRSRLVTAVVAWAVIVVPAVISVLALSPPAPVPADAPASDFSAERAMAHVRQIARQPHPMGSPQLAAVREYLEAQLRSAGLDPQIQEAVTRHGGGRGWPGRGNTVRNIVARLPGTEGGPAVLLVSHYDSAPGAPGAADDGACVAAMLETLRALRAGPPLRRDVIFLFTDGEEAGLLGARAFVEEHPWAREAGVVLNFENRGNRGPVVMFETSDENGWLVRRLARVVQRPIASSLTDTVYRRMPNDTDFSVFRRAGFQGLNFACIDGVEHYHAPTDTPDNLDPRTLQHHGASMLALARRLASDDADPRRQPNGIYFDLLGRVLVIYPERWAIPLTAAAVLAYVGVVAAGLRSRALTPLGMVAGLGVFLLTIAGGVLVTMLMAKIASGPLRGTWLRAAFLAATLATGAAAYAATGGRIRLRNQAAGALLGWLAGAIVVACWLPGASYLTLWPLLFGTAGLAVLTAIGRREPSSPGVLAVVLLAAAPGVLLFVPLSWLMYIALGPRQAFVVSAMLAFLLGSMTPALRLACGRR